MFLSVILCGPEAGLSTQSGHEAEFELATMISRRLGETTQIRAVSRFLTKTTVFYQVFKEIMDIFSLFAPDGIAGVANQQFDGNNA